MAENTKSHSSFRNLLGAVRIAAKEIGALKREVEDSRAELHDISKKLYALKGTLELIVEESELAEFSTPDVVEHIVKSCQRTISQVRLEVKRLNEGRAKNGSEYKWIGSPLLDKYQEFIPIHRQALEAALLVIKISNDHSNSPESTLKSTDKKTSSQFSSNDLDDLQKQIDDLQVEISRLHVNHGGKSSRIQSSFMLRRYVTGSDTESNSINADISTMPDVTCLSRLSYSEVNSEQDPETMEQERDPDPDPDPEPEPEQEPEIEPIVEETFVEIPVAIPAELYDVPLSCESNVQERARMRERCELIGLRRNFNGNFVLGNDYETGGAGDKQYIRIKAKFFDGLTGEDLTLAVFAWVKAFTLAGGGLNCWYLVEKSPSTVKVRKPLGSALFLQDMAWLDWLLIHQVDVNTRVFEGSKNKSDMYPTNYAVYWNFRAVEKLQKAGADVNQAETLSILCSVNYETVRKSKEMSATSAETTFQLVKYLVAYGADVDPVGATYGNPIILAAYAGKIKILKFLLSKGANVNFIDEKLGTALHQAVYGNQLDAAELLVSAGAKLIEVKTFGGTPLEFGQERANRPQDERDRGLKKDWANWEGLLALCPKVK